MIDNLSKRITVSYKEFAKHFKPLLIIAIILAVLGTIAGIIYQIEYNAFEKLSVAFNIQQFIGSIISIPLIIIFSIALSGAYMVYVFRIVEKKETTFTDSHKFFWSRFLPLIWTGILHVLVVTAGFILFIIPGIIFSIYYSFVYTATLFRGKSGPSALSYSWRLIKNNWWETVLYGIMFFAATSVLSFIFMPLQIVAELITSYVGNMILAFIVGVLSSTASALLSMYFYFFMSHYFLELEKEKKLE